MFSRETEPPAPLRSATVADSKVRRFILSSTIFVDFCSRDTMSALSPDSESPFFPRTLLSSDKGQVAQKGTYFLYNAPSPVDLVEIDKIYMVLAEERAMSSRPKKIRIYCKFRIQTRDQERSMVRHLSFHRRHTQTRTGSCQVVEPGDESAHTRTYLQKAAAFIW
jgi:hypothetical protein